MDEIETFPTTDKEYSALINIRGLKEKAHYMVWGAKEMKGGGHLLRGSSEAFDELIFDVNDEINYELSPTYRLKQLEKLYRRLAPDDDEL
jgi:hypothetical protein